MKKSNIMNLLTSDSNQIIEAIGKCAVVGLTDREGKIISVNENFCKLSGYSEDELLGQDHRILNSGYHSKEFFENLWNTILSGQIWSGLIQNINKNGDFYWVEASYYLVV